VWMLRDLEERKVDFEETWAILYKAGVVAASVEERFASDYIIVDGI
jgi:hypothetical protein